MTKYALLKVAATAALMLALLSTHPIHPDKTRRNGEKPRSLAIQGRAITATHTAPAQVTTQQITPVAQTLAKQPVHKKQSKTKGKKKKAQRKKDVRAATVQAQQKSVYRRVVNAQHTLQRAKSRVVVHPRQKPVLRVGQRNIATTVTHSSAPAKKKMQNKGNLRAVTTKYQGMEKVPSKKKMQKSKEKMKKKNEKERVAHAQDVVKK